MNHTYRSTQVTQLQQLPCGIGRHTCTRIYHVLLLFSCLHYGKGMCSSSILKTYSPHLYTTLDRVSRLPSSLFQTSISPPSRIQGQNLMTSLVFFIKSQSIHFFSHHVVIVHLFLWFVMESCLNIVFMYHYSEDL